jgi:dihydroorotase
MGQKGKKLTNFREMKPYIKALSDDGICVSDLALVKEGMYEAKNEGLIICSHAEAKEYGEGAESEVRAVERELNLVAETKCKYHFCHLSTSEAVERVRLAKVSKLDVSCEVTPHHIFLCQNNMQYNPNFKMSPALRTHGDMRRTLQGLIAGVIDMLATDHAPHTEKEKSLPMDKAPNGVIGLETLLPLAYTGLVRTGKLTFEKMMDVLTFNAAKRFNLPCGKVEVGGLADLAVLDIDTPHVYTYDEILSKGKNSPFIGTEMYGMNKLTILDGNVVFDKISKG